MGEKAHFIDTLHSIYYLEFLKKILFIYLFDGGGERERESEREREQAQTG